MNTTTTNTDGTVGAAQISVIQAVRIGYSAAAMLPAEECTACTIALVRAHRAGNLAEVRSWLETIAVLLEGIEGTWDVWQAVRAAARRIVCLESLPAAA